MRADAVTFMAVHAGVGYHPDRETFEQGRQRGAIELAVAESWAWHAGIEFVWESDWSIGSHSDFYGPGSAYEAREPDTCEQVTAVADRVVFEQDGRIIASLGCVDDATPEYRRVVEAELALEAMYESGDVFS